jgi:hypothetical protein
MDPDDIDKIKIKKLSSLNETDIVPKPMKKIRVKPLIDDNFKVTGMTTNTPKSAETSAETTSTALSSLRESPIA